jgi:hypothetical protein
LGERIGRDRRCIGDLDTDRTRSGRAGFCWIDQTPAYWEVKIVPQLVDINGKLPWHRCS